MTDAARGAHTLGPSAGVEHHPQHYTLNGACEIRISFRANYVIRNFGRDRITTERKDRCDDRNTENIIRYYVLVVN